MSVRRSPHLLSAIDRKKVSAEVLPDGLFTLASLSSALLFIADKEKEEPSDAPEHNEAKEHDPNACDLWGKLPFWRRLLGKGK